MVGKKSYAVLAAVAAVALGAFGFSAVASAQTGRFEVFDHCPSTNPEVKECIYSLTTGGSVKLGSQVAPITNPVVLQGGYNYTSKTKSYTFYGASGAPTLVPTPQPVPGGLAGLVKCEELEPKNELFGVLRGLCKGVFENGLTGVNATLELARPANEIGFSERNLLADEGVALKLPVKIHLENPLLGSNCYVGSEADPIIWNLTTGTTSPPAPNEPITGNSGRLKEEDEILTITGNELVDNAFAVPGATGCGPLPFSEYLIDPVINAKLSLPSAEGNNSAVLKNTIEVAESAVVNDN